MAPTNEYNPDKVHAPPDENAPEGYDWLGQPRDPEIEALRKLTVDQCSECGPNGRYVRYCSIHGLHGKAPR